MTTSIGLLHRFLSPLGLGVGLFSSACIIAGPLDDDDNVDPDTGYLDDGGTTDAQDDDAGDEEGGTDAGTTGDDGDPDLSCGENLVEDPGFEQPADETPWEVSSIVFETLICDASCTEEPGVGPYAGDQWAWFGGTDKAETAFVEQTVEVPTAETARLVFYLAMDVSEPLGDDVFRVFMDDTLLFEATEADIDAYEEYARVEVDISEFADGAAHLLAFEGLFTEGGLTNFLLDEVELATCDEDDDDGTTGGDPDDGTTGGDPDDGTTGGDPDDGTTGGDPDEETGTTGNTDGDEEGGSTGDGLDEGTETAGA